MMRPTVHPGTWLLGSRDPGLVEHRRRFGDLRRLTAGDLEEAARSAGVLGRGGAGFPLAVKLAAATGRRVLRRHVVVNLSEGEPASAKDAALVLTSPHLILDGAALVAAALGVREVDLVVPGELSWVEQALVAAVDERTAAGEDRRLRWRIHRAAPRFVAGEASAVTNLIEGGENLPSTSWVPAAVRGVHGRPTLLSNGETFAQLAALVQRPRQVPGTPDEPGTRLLSITRGGSIEVIEVAHGTPWREVLTPDELDGPILLGGYHGQWSPAGALRTETVSAPAMRALGLSLGAGIVLALSPGTCPLTYTAGVLRYLAQQSAGRCGPCVNGLPALAEAFEDLVRGRSGPITEPGVEAIAALVHGRGACAHPDGTARLVVSACTTFPDEVALHRNGGCASHPRPVLRSA